MLLVVSVAISLVVAATVALGCGVVGAVVKAERETLADTRDA